MKDILWIPIFAVIVILMSTQVFAGDKDSNDSKDKCECKCKCCCTDVHVVLKAEDKDTEMEVKVDNQKRHTKILKKGVNFLKYSTREDKPVVTVWTYGDKNNLKVEKVDGEWYAYKDIKRPRDGDSYND